MPKEDAGGQTKKPRPRRSGHWISAEHLQQLNAAGLLVRVWPASRLLVGVCVCRWLRNELLAQHNEVVITSTRRFKPFTGEHVARTLCRFSEKSMTIIWTEMPEFSSEHDEAEDGTLCARNPLLDGMEIALASNKDAFRELLCLDLRNQTGDLDEGIGREGGLRLAKILESCTSLQTLNLTGQGIGEQGIRALAGVFQSCTGLTALHLEYNDVETGVECLAACTNLKKLKLGGCEEGFGDELPDTLECLTSLTDLDLAELSNYQDIDDVIESLEHHRHLVSLNLSDLGDIEESAPTLSRILLNNSASLTFLDLTHAFLGPDGMRAIAGALGHCTALTTLHLGFNRIKLGGAQLFAALPWEQCTRLHTVDLADNLLLSQGVPIVTAALARCCCLQKLYLGGNSIGNPKTVGKQVREAAAAALPHCRLVWFRRNDVW